MVRGRRRAAADLRSVGLRVILPARPEDATALLNNLIDTTASVLATIPGHQARTTEPSNRQ